MPLRDHVQVRWVWRTPLDKSQPHWSAWYTGLSEQFMQVGARGENRARLGFRVGWGTDRCSCHQGCTCGQLEGEQGSPDRTAIATQHCQIPLPSRCCCGCLSQVPCPKMLLLAGTDRLDKVLTIGQMQGKFQLAVLPMAGHAIQVRWRHGHSDTCTGAGGAA